MNRIKPQDKTCASRARTRSVPWEIIYPVEPDKKEGGHARLEKTWLRRANMETRTDRNSRIWRCAQMETARKHGNAHKSKFANMEMRADEDAQTWKRAQIEIREYGDARK